MTRKNISLIALFLFIAASRVFAQDEKMYAKFFPEPANKIPVPIIRGDSTRNYYTSYKDAVSFVRGIVSQHSDLITLTSIGTTQKRKDEIAVIFNKKSTIDDNLKARVMFISGIHGNEPIAPEAMLYLIQQLAENKDYDHLLDNIILEVVPMVNIDGRTAESRPSNNDVDLNRDLTILNGKESSNIKNAVNKFNPQVIVDFHEFKPDRNDFLDLNDCLTPAYDALFLYTGNLNVNPEIRASIETDFVDPAKKFLEQHERRVHDYCTTRFIDKEVILNMGGIASRSSATNYALQNRISILMEIRGLSEKEKAAKRRIETSFLTAISYLQTVNADPQKIIAIAREANHETANSTRKVVVRSEPKMTVEPFLFVDACKLEYRTIDFNARNNLYQTPTLERERPAAYVIYPCSEKLKNILLVSGVVITELKNGADLNNVECYTLDKADKISIVKKNISVSSPAVLIDMHQPMGNVVADLLEPEGGNSFYQNDLLKKLINRKDDLLPIFRLNSEQLLQIKK